MTVPPHDEPPEQLAALRELAESLARGAGEIALGGRRQAGIGNSTGDPMGGPTGGSMGSSMGGSMGGDTKSSRTDVVTEFDRAAEAYVVDTLRRLRPDDAIVGEEGTADDGASGYEWYVDPIDGTTNFVYDQPAWSSSVAVAHHGEMVAGAVVVPPLDEIFSAALGNGATLNGRPIRASGITDLSVALVGTGFGYQPTARRVQADQLVGLITRVRDIRRLGSAAVDLCFVACGRLDVYYEQHLNSWDAAAGELIAREAGAITSDFDGGAARPEEMVAAAPGVHRSFLDALAASRPSR